MYKQCAIVMLMRFMNNSLRNDITPSRGHPLHDDCFWPIKAFLLLIIVVVVVLLIIILFLLCILIILLHIVGHQRGLRRRFETAELSREVSGDQVRRRRGSLVQIVGCSAQLSQVGRPCLQLWFDWM